MTEQTEHRGWEIENDYHQHFLDDADFVFDGEEESVGWFWGIAALAVALCVGAWLLGKWLEPPVAVFQAPRIFVQEASAPAASGSKEELASVLAKWTASCLRVDTKARVIRPNWENPNCRLPK